MPIPLPVKTQPRVHHDDDHRCGQARLRRLAHERHRGRQSQPAAARTERPHAHPIPLHPAPPFCGQCTRQRPQLGYYARQRRVHARRHVYDLPVCAVCGVWWTARRWNHAFYRLKFPPDIDCSSLHSYMSERALCKHPSLRITSTMDGHGVWVVEHDGWCGVRVVELSGGSAILTFVSLTFLVTMIVFRVA